VSPERLTSVPAMQRWSDDRRTGGQIVAVVPTMGALHDGHLALIAEARRRADAVIVTIFVNPLQFDRRDDFDRYPRPIDDDLAVCAAAGVDAVYCPLAATMYPPGFQTRVVPGSLAARLEGAARPGHFEGVTTVVAKLLTATRPHLAVFGEKDFQQLAIVRRMVADLDLGVDIVGHPTVREADGLALSSRNRRLTPAQRAAAVCVPRSLDALRALATAGERDVARLRAAAAALVTAEPLASFEYATVVDPDTLDELETLAGPARALTAVWFDDVRLIDNLAVGPSTAQPSSRA
jgi:pantoate--beta-alanine ligase